jgi:hypothetical protein
VAKATHNLWHTGTRHQQYFGDALHRAASWGKLRKSMERWHLPPYFWTKIEKDTNHYTEHSHKRTANSKDNEPQKPFGVTFNASRNLLQQAFRTQ